MEDNCSRQWCLSSYLTPMALMSKLHRNWLPRRSFAARVSTLVCLMSLILMASQVRSIWMNNSSCQHSRTPLTRWCTLPEKIKMVCESYWLSRTARFQCSTMIVVNSLPSRDQLMMVKHSCLSLLIFKKVANMLSYLNSRRNTELLTDKVWAIAIILSLLSKQRVSLK